MYTIKQLADLAGLSTRTLRHYDDIGLLRPSSVGANGYRYYDETKVARLQEILLYRELGMELSRIGAIINNPRYQPLKALRAHHQDLEKRLSRLQTLVDTVARTITTMEGGSTMEPVELFKGLRPEEEEAMMGEAMEDYDPGIVADSWKKWRSYSKAKQEEILAQGNGIYKALVATIPLGPGNKKVQGLIQKWRDHMDNFWTPKAEQLVDLARGYRDDPRFRKNFDAMDPRLADFMVKAVEIYRSGLKDLTLTEPSK